MPYANGGCGPFEPAKLNKNYRGLLLQSNAASAVDLVVKSAGQSQLIHLEPGETLSGTLVIESGILTSLKGYLE